MSQKPRNASSRFPGHKNRVQSYIQRIRDHLREHPEDKSGYGRTDTGDTDERTESE